MVAEIRVGTSGYSFRDWVGTVYPSGTRAAEYFGRYARDFDAVEVNSTFYRIPSPDVTMRMAEKAPSGYCFTVKAPRQMSHNRDGYATAEGPFLRALKPLADGGMLGGILVQFPQSFHREKKSAEVLPRLADTFRSAGHRVFVEFRHCSWYCDAVFGRMQDLGLGMVNVDLPAIGSLPEPSSIATSDAAYVRLHGRNRDMWHDHPTPSHRYDYSYADRELDEWVARIEQMAQRVGIVFAFTNNCHMGSSYVDALRIKQRLGQPVRCDADAPTTLFESRDEGTYVATLARRVTAAREREQETVQRWRQARPTGVSQNER